MPKKAFVVLYSRGKDKASETILAFAMAYLRGRYNGGAFTKTVIDATMCAIITNSFVTSQPYAD